MLNFYDKNTILNINLKFKDIYYIPEYAEACEFSDNAEVEYCVYKDLIYLYLKKKYYFEDVLYYDLITLYGYSGYYYENIDTFDEFLLLFKDEAKKRNYITEVVRQNPYLNLSINNYDIIVSRTTFGIDLKKYKSFDGYLKNTSKDNKRGYNIACKNNLKFEILDFNKDTLNEFIKIYNFTMNKLNATDYYYFNDGYYNSLLKMKDNILLATIKKDDKIISSSIIFKYGNFLHYHIGGSFLEDRNIRPNNFLHCNIIQYGIENNYNMYHLGGGLKDNDNLYIFKDKIGDIKYNYVIYKNIINKEIYKKISLNFENKNYFPIHRQ